ncbi:hypothetical protein B5G52_16575 [Pseudoalteromonas sp. A601]|uniref:hypothetical protein n=1 Tax=Pseudoalteromonas sp. A601 TaxID=1967839 RepID=UPI000B3D3D4E|nr:hypothetical protein [Pseudoalteromonas sp. A601]OUS69512.1 hypothetical protein B5G52_16575 [Pseudoalteromonas sp. A601]
MGAASGNQAANLAPKKPQSKTERANLYILAHPEGATELDILRNVGLSSGRNYFTDLERDYGFTFTREKIPNSDGIGGHYKYSFYSIEVAQMIIKAINKSRVHRKLAEFTSEQKVELLKPIKYLLDN